MYLQKTVLVAVIGLTLPTLVFAEEETILVTASRQPESISEALASATIYDREEIERSQARSLPELLSQAPGLNIATNGGRGGATSIFMRGTNSNHVLVLIDGIKATSPTLGASQLQNLSLEQVERIEIVRGPRSSLYGSEAIGGVIQIFTRKGEQGFHPRLSLGAGGYDSYQGSVGFSGGTGNASFGLQLDGESTQGYDVCRNNILDFNCGYEPDRDGFNNKSLGLNFGYRFNERLDVGLNFLNSSGTNENDSGYTNKTDYRQQTLAFNANLKATDIWSISLNAGQYLDNSDNFQGSTFVNYLNTSRTNLSLQNTFQVAEHQSLILGLDQQNDEVDATTLYTRTQNENRGLFGQWKGAFGQHEFQFGLRRDDNDQFGQHDTGNLAWGYGFSDNLRLFASYGTAFAAPTFNDLYYPYGMGNPDLKPSISESLELGLKGSFGSGSWRASLYQTDIDNLISLNAFYIPENIAKARIQGLELGLDTQILGWQVSASLDLIDPRNLTKGPDYKNKLARRPEQKLSLSLDRDFGRYSLGGSLLAQSESFNDSTYKAKLDGFARLDLRGEYRFDRNWRLQATLDNVSDERYETVKNYRQPGRTFFLKLRYAM